ncbi:hypothetical protein [Croceivirga thetidis]|uniref:Uncharacterized protein n=1 Tax=Croceivirga thetidis TaxID=2721623 RepID=A0ABX1GWH1_9FLAO|nr:hypothetical protein [Croceivirga thetidis]NKI33356.1 hypothetical protein [Croceivirga thetidis]
MLVINRNTLLVFLFLVTAVSSYSQLGTAYLEDEQSSDQFKPIEIVSTTKELVKGYGFIHPLNHREIIFMESKPVEEKTKDWRIVKDFSEFKMLDKDTVHFVAFTGKRPIHKTLVVKYNESDCCILYKAISPMLYDAYFIAKKGEPRTLDNGKMVAIRNMGSFNRTAKKAFSNDCPVIVKNVKENTYTNTEAGLMDLIKDYQEQCPTLN